MHRCTSASKALLTWAVVKVVAPALVRTAISAPVNRTFDESADGGDDVQPAATHIPVTMQPIRPNRAPRLPEDPLLLRHLTGTPDRCRRYRVRDEQLLFLVNSTVVGLNAAFIRAKASNAWRRPVAGL